ncbi:MAG: DUF4870 domain-containing protein [Planctomycetota bacterium]
MVEADVMPGERSERASYEVDSAKGVARAVDLAEDQRAYASWIHWGSLIALGSVIFSTGIAFFVPLLVALAMWQIRRNDHPFIDDHGREALNFQISLILLGIILFVAALLLTFGTALPLVVFGMPVLGIVGCIMGGLAAGRSEYFRYPMCIRLIKGPADAPD